MAEILVEMVGAFVLLTMAVIGVILIIAGIDSYVRSKR